MERVRAVAAGGEGDGGCSDVTFDPAGGAAITRRTSMAPLGQPSKGAVVAVVGHSELEVHSGAESLQGLLEGLEGDMAAVQEGTEVQAKLRDELQALKTLTYALMTNT